MGWCMQYHLTSGGHLMSNNEKFINREILKVCEEILPKTAMRNNQQIKKLLKSIKDYLDGQE